VGGGVEGIFWSPLLTRQELTTRNPVFNNTQFSNVTINNWAKKTALSKIFLDRSYTHRIKIAMPKTN
jgi:hypothetical protein